MVHPRAAHVAIVPLSQVSTASSVASSSIRPATYCGAMGSRSALTMLAMFRRHLPISFWYLLRNEVPFRCLSRGSRAWRVCLLSPTTGSSVGVRAPARAGSASTCATRTFPGGGRCLVYGKLVPTSSRVSMSDISSADGLVPSRPIPPVVYGESSGTAAFPDSVFTTGADRVSASASSSSRACRAPAAAGSWPGRFHHVWAWHARRSPRRPTGRTARRAARASSRDHRGAASSGPVP